MRHRKAREQLNRKAVEWERVMYIFWLWGKASAIVRGRIGGEGLGLRAVDFAAGIGTC